MKIAFNAIRVSNKAGSGFDTFIINFINTFAKHVYSEPRILDSGFHFDIYTLYPQHFSNIKKENIKQIKIPFLNQFRYTKPQRNNKNELQNKKKLSLLTPIYYILHTLYCLFGDYFRMFWTQFVFPFYAKKYDLVVAMTEYDASLFFKNQIVIVHSTVPFLFPKFPTKYRFYTYKLLPKILKKCLRVITVSGILKEEIAHLFKIDLHKISVIYEGVNRKNFYPASKQEIDNFKRQFQLPDEYILTIGHSHPIKNFFGIISSFSLLREKYKTNLVVAGYMDKKIKISDGIRYIGHIPNNYLYLLYSSAKCFVFSTLHEGFGLPPLEAMACGCPVIVSDRGSLPEVCGDAAVYVDPCDPKNIAEGIIKVLSNENLRRELIKKGFKQVKKFSWDESAKKFIKLLQNI